MGLHDVWINQYIWSINLDEIKIRITDVYKQNRYACINKEMIVYINMNLNLKNS